MGNSYLSNVNKQYLIGLFHSLIPAYVIERLFWQERAWACRAWCIARSSTR